MTRGPTRVIALAAISWGAAYLAWRVVATRHGAAAEAWVLLLVTELLGFAVFATRSWHSWPSRRSAQPCSVELNLSVVLDATGAPVDEMRTTLIAVRAMNPRPDVHVVDERGNRWVRTVAERVGATVLDRDVDVAAAIVSAPTDRVLRLRAGDVPVPDLIERVGRSGQDDAAVVQLAVASLDPGPLDDDLGPLSRAAAFEHEVMRPSLSGRTSVPWYGDSPALIRRDALAALAERERTVDSPADESDRWWRSGIELLRAGERITAISEMTVRRRPPRSVGGALKLRREVARVRRGALRGPDRPTGVGLSTGAAHVVSAWLPMAAAWVRLLQVATVVLVLGFGRVPLGASIIGICSLAAPAYLLRWAAHLALGQGRLRPLSLLRSELRTLGADLSLPGSSSRPSWSGVVALLGMLAALTGAVGTAGFAFWRGWDDHLPGMTAVAAFALASVAIGILTGVVADSHGALQRRAHHRIRLGMVTCRLEEHEGFLLDLSGGGVSVALPAVGAGAPSPGDVTTLSFRVPAPDGRWRAVSTIVHVVRSSVDDQGDVRLGLQFDDATAGPIDAVVEFLTVGSPCRLASSESHR